MKTFIMILGLIAIGYGIVGIYAAWRAPGLFSRGLYGPGMLGANVASDRPGLVMKLCSATLIGSYLALVGAGATALSLLPLAGYAALAFALLRRRPPTAG